MLCLLLLPVGGYTAVNLTITEVFFRCFNFIFALFSLSVIIRAPLPSQIRGLALHHLPPLQPHLHWHRVRVKWPRADRDRNKNHKESGIPQGFLVLPFLFLIQRGVLNQALHISVSVNSPGGSPRPKGLLITVSSNFLGKGVQHSILRG